MRKPRDFDSEMKALSDRAKLLKERKVHQLGELVIACGANVLQIDVLAGAMLAAVDTKDAATIEGWRERGAAFFQRPMRRSTRKTGRDTGVGAANNDSIQSSAADPRAL